MLWLYEFFYFISSVCISWDYFFVIIFPIADSSIGWSLEVVASVAVAAAVVGVGTSIRVAVAATIAIATVEGLSLSLPLEVATIVGSSVAGIAVGVGGSGVARVAKSVGSGSITTIVAETSVAVEGIGVSLSIPLEVAAIVGRSVAGIAVGVGGSGVAVAGVAKSVGSSGIATIVAKASVAVDGIRVGLSLPLEVAAVEGRSIGRVAVTVGSIVVGVGGSVAIAGIAEVASVEAGISRGDGGEGKDDLKARESFSLP